MAVEKENQLAFGLSLAVVILCVGAIVAFIYSGGSLLFYTVAIVAIIVGFYMAYAVSKTGSAPKKQKRKRS